MVSMAKEVNSAGLMFQFCRNCVNCDQWSVTAQAFIHQNLHDRSQTKVVSFGCTPLSQICSKCLRDCLPCPCKTHPPSMSFQKIMSHDGILLNSLKVFSMLPHFEYMWTNLFPVKVVVLQLLWMNCSWVHMPSSIAPMMAHALSIPTKVARCGLTHSCCIHWNSSSAFCLAHI